MLLYLNSILLIHIQQVKIDLIEFLMSNLRVVVLNKSLVFFYQCLLYFSIDNQIFLKLRLFENNFLLRFKGRLSKIIHLLLSLFRTFSLSLHSRQVFELILNCIFKLSPAQLHQRLYQINHNITLPNQKSTLLGLIIVLICVRSMS